MKEFMKKNKKNIVLGVTILLIAIAAIGTTLALLTSKTDGLTNTFTKGNIKTELVEKFIKNTETDFTKEPMVANTGANDCYVRIRMQVTPESAMDNLEITGFNDSVWIPADDGWYYYNTVLEVGKITSPLFTNVKIKDYEKWVDFDIILYQEAVQTVKDETGNVLEDQPTIRNAFAEYIKR